MKAHKTLIPLALFALAFVGALLVQRRPGAAAPGPVTAMSSAQWLRVAGLRSGTAVTSADSLRPADDAPSNGPSNGLSNGREESRSRPPPPATPGAVPEAEDPVVASDGPPGVPRSVESIADAVDALKHSGSVDDRVRAVQSLAEAARSGHEVSRVRASLHYAAADENPEVATRAQQEYDALVEREDR